MAAQKATDIRRLRSEVEADQAALRTRQADLEDLLAAAHASNWADAVEKGPLSARYLCAERRRNGPAPTKIDRQRHG